MNDSVIITALTRDDTDGFLQLVTDERTRLSTYFPVTTSSVTDRRSARDYVKELLVKARARETYCFLLRDYEGDIPAGAVFLKQFDWSVPKCEIAYFTSDLHKRRGFATMGVIWAVDHAFSVLGVRRVFARVDPANAPSIRVLEKCAFEREGLMRSDFRSGDGRLLDVMHFGRVR